MSLGRAAPDLLQNTGEAAGPRLAHTLHGVLAAFPEPGMDVIEMDIKHATPAVIRKHSEKAYVLIMARAKPVSQLMRQSDCAAAQAATDAVVVAFRMADRCDAGEHFGGCARVMSHCAASRTPMP